ncbi:MAG: acyl--CoA ligase [Gammaproteobacteria bacterium]|nr:acyl--CoA ligase [Gammaproteobacteria bacterium]
MTSAFTVPELLIPELIAQHGAWLADKPAAVEGGRVLDWRAFDAATNRVGNALLAAGLAPGDRVAVLAGNSIDMLLVLFGCGKAGLSVVPLNISITDAAVAGMIADCSARAIVASDGQCARIDGLLAAQRLPASLLRIAIAAPGSLPGWLDFADFQAGAAATRPPLTVSGSSECNIIYSSGTTALPKGIVHSQQCRAHWAVDMALALRYHSGAVTLCSLGLYSNITWVSMLATLWVGGTLVIMPAFSAAGMVEYIERYRITHGSFAPVQLQRLLELPEPARRDCRSLQTIMCCGSPLAPAVKRAVRDALGCQLIELYGLTEGIITTLAPEDFDRRLASVGKPVPGQELALLGDDARLVPPGEPGEIVGCGRMVMQGYLNRPEATAEATWTAPDGRRWLRTGDIGRLDADGFLYIVDRKKDMILSGGQNIYPADIETVLREHPDVVDAAVIGVPSEQWGETPLAVVVLRAGTRHEAAQLVAWTNERVGRQQRISGVVLRDELPRNPNGKVLKRELRAQLLAGPAAAPRRDQPG